MASGLSSVGNIKDSLTEILEKIIPGQENANKNRVLTVEDAAGKLAEASGKSVEEVKEWLQAHPEVVQALSDAAILNQIGAMEGVSDSAKAEAYNIIFSGGKIALDSNGVPLLGSDGRFIDPMKGISIAAEQYCQCGIHADGRQ